jgi:AcrR family transcriptional regulator
MEEEPLTIEDRRVDARRNHEQIIDGAITVLGADPGASLQDIATAAGLHRATLHRHFRSREDLLEAIRRRSAERVLAAYRDALDSGAPPAEALHATVRRVLSEAAPDALWRFGSYYGPGTDEYRAELVALGTSIVEAAQRIGDVRTDLPPRLLYAVWTGVSYSMMPLLSDGIVDIDAAVATIMSTLRGAP